MILTIVAFVAVLSILVLVHEMGHFFTARKFGAKCEEFGLGYPPRAIGWYQKADKKWYKVLGNKEVKDAISTVYSINWVPLGGFVKIKGENGEDENAKDSFSSKKIWQRGIILSAGVTMNVVLAGVLFSIGMMMGIPQMLDTKPEGAEVTEPQIQVVQVLKDAPATDQMKLGDIILAVDGQELIKNQDLIEYTNSMTGQEVVYTIRRAGDEQDIILIPEVLSETGQGSIGVAIAEIGLVKYPWYSAIYHGFKTAFIMLWAIILGLFGLIASLFVDNGVTAEVAGPVGIAVLTGQMAHMGIIYLMQFTALLSLNLALINFLPIPALDGGRIMFLIIEKIKGSPVKRETEAIIHNIGFMLLMLLVVIITFKDVSDMVCWTCKIKEFFN